MPDKLCMKEELLHYLWNSKALVAYSLYGSKKECIRIINPGIFNRDQGPDFLFAQIEINKVLWVGNVEIHIKASDWHKHLHTSDPNYNNIILHVVWENDIEVRLHGQLLTCVELKKFVPVEFLEQYRNLMGSINRVPCQHFLGLIDPIVKANVLERLMIERLEIKTDLIRKELEILKSDWEELMYRKIAHYLVAPVNCEPMEELCKNLPLELIRKLSHDVRLIESSLFGASGFLANPGTDEYHKELTREYSFLKKKYNIEEIPVFSWKFLRLRPAHFPSTRLAQWAALLHKHPRIFSKIIEVNSIGELLDVFEVQTSPYWSEHYHFRKAKKKAFLGIGQNARKVIIVNAICPILFAYGQINSRPEICSKAMLFLEKLKYESNTISRMWKSFNFVMKHAGHSQAGIQLFHEYCVQKKCTQCQIGHIILKQSLCSIQDQA